MKRNRLTVRDTASLMNVSQEFVRAGLQQGLFPWGYALKMSTQWTYFVNANKFYELENIRMEGEKNERME